MWTYAGFYTTEQIFEWFNHINVTEEMRDLMKY
jgi:hypothetical protein